MMIDAEGTAVCFHLLGRDGRYIRRRNKREREVGVGGKGVITLM